jgi:hypothetical protein
LCFDVTGVTSGYPHSPSSITERSITSFSRHLLAISASGSVATVLRSVVPHGAGAALTAIALTAPVAVASGSIRFGSWIQFRQDAQEGHVAGTLLFTMLLAQAGVSALLTRRHKAGTPLVPTQWNFFAVLAHLGWFAVWGWLFAFTGGMHAPGTQIGFGHDVGILTPLVNGIATPVIICAGAYTARYLHHRRGDVIVSIVLVATTASILVLLVLAS